MIEITLQFKKGDIVYERIHPNQKLIINQCDGKIFYCHIFDNPRRKCLVFFDWELTKEGLVSYSDNLTSY